MQKIKNKTMTILIVAILLFSMMTSIALLPNTNAHTPKMTIPTYAYLSVMPNPVGVGQTAYIGFWLDKTPPTAYQEYGDRWHNFVITVTTPDGKNETLGPFTSDAAGGAATTYIPMQLGNYTFVFNYPGETLAGANPSPLAGTVNPIFVGDYFAPSTSEQMSLNVQQEPITLSVSYTHLTLPTNREV